MTLMLVTPTTAQFWGMPNKHWKDPAWQHLARAYLERIVSAVPGTAIKQFSSGIDIKHGNKPVPISLLHGHGNEIAEAMRQVMRDVEAYCREGTGV